MSRKLPPWPRRLLVEENGQLRVAVLLGVTDLAELAGVDRNRIKKWRAMKSDPFPAPIAETRAGPLWDIEDYRRWSVAYEERRAKHRERIAAKEARIRAQPPATGPLAAAADDEEDWRIRLERMANPS